MVNDNLQQQLKLMYDYWFSQFDFPNNDGKPYRTSGGIMLWNDQIKRDLPSTFSIATVSDLCSIATGTEYAGFATKNGKYRFFTCSKDTLWCDKPAFNGKSLIVATHGDFHVEHYSGEFNAYFCNSVIQPKNDIYYGLIYCSILRYLPTLQRGSNGSIIKFIGNAELGSIPVIIPENLELLRLFNDILIAKERNSQEIKHLSCLRDFLLPVLMNGQATIVD